MAAGYGLDGQGIVIRVPVRATFLSSYRPDKFWCPHTPYPLGTEGSSPGVKRPGLETNLNLVPRLRIRGFIHPFPHSSPWCSA
jgi:hypothetical protein